MHSQKIDGKKFATDNRGMIDGSKTSLSPHERRESYPYRAEHVAPPNYTEHAKRQSEESRTSMMLLMVGIFFTAAHVIRSEYLNRWSSIDAGKARYVSSALMDAPPPEVERVIPHAPLADEVESTPLMEAFPRLIIHLSADDMEPEKIEGVMRAALLKFMKSAPAGFETLTIEIHTDEPPSMKVQQLINEILRELIPPPVEYPAA